MLTNFNALKLIALVLVMFTSVTCRSKTVGLDHSQNKLLTGKGVIKFEYQHIKDMNVWYYIPSEISSATPVLFVMHGVKRNADEYRDGWIEAAETSKFILIVPEFSQALFPGSRAYNLGNLFTQDGKTNPETQWSFNLIEPIFDLVQSKTNNKTQRYHLFGHSAGSQFVHRYMMFASYQRLGLLMAANAGWYTMLDDSESFPYGLKNSPKSLKQLKPVFKQEVVILLGENDNDPNAEFLRQTPEAKAQGAHRFARGQNFYNQASATAKQRKLPFNWRLVTVPKVGHNNKGMADIAAKLLTEHTARR